MKGIQKLLLAKTILERDLTVPLKNINFEPKLARIFFELRDGSQIYIRYNNHNRYSYSIIFSLNELDRCRFDNFDDRWPVKTKPNHFHPRSIKNGVPSPMTGDPNEDIPLLCNLIKSGKLLLVDNHFKI